MKRITTKNENQSKLNDKNNFTAGGLDDEIKMEENLEKLKTFIVILNQCIFLVTEVAT